MKKYLKAINKAVAELITTEHRENFTDSFMKGMAPIGECLDIDRIQVWQNEIFNGALHFV